MDVIATIANLAYKRPAVQNAFSKLDIVAAVLSNCAFDPANPGVREWALLALRNLTEGNAAVQQRVRELTGSSVLQDAEMAERGERVVLDRASGTFVLQGPES